MAHNEGKATLIGPVLKFTFPEPRTVSIATAGIGFDHQMRRPSVTSLTVALPPTANGSHRKHRCRRTNSQHHKPMIGLLVIDPIRYRSMFGFTAKIIRVDNIGILAQSLARILEVADQFGLLRIHADHGLTMTNAHGFDTLDEAILLIALRMRFADQTLNVRLERVTKWSQKSSNGGPGRPAKPVGKRTQTATSIDSMPFGIATGILLNELS